MNNINPKTGKQYKTSIAQREANKRSRAKNPESTKAKQYRTAKSYMNKHATASELYELIALANQQLDKKMSRQEVCPECDKDSLIDVTSFEIQKCSECGAKLIPCSICPNFGECKDCKFKNKEE